MKTQHNQTYKYPHRALYGLMANAIDRDPPDLELIDQTLALLQRLRDSEVDRSERRFLQGLLSRLRTVRQFAEGKTEGFTLYG